MPQNNQDQQIITAQVPVVKKKVRYPLLTIITGITCLILIVSLIGYFVWSASQRPKVVQIDRLNLTNFNSPYRIGTDFTIANEQGIEVKDKNSYFTPKGDFSMDSIRNGAIKLGLSNESSNSQLKFRAWTKQGVNDLNSDFVTVDEASRILQIRYSSGLNQNNLNENEYYNFIADFFGLNKSNIELATSIKGENNILDLTYSYKLNGQKVFFSDVEDIYASITVINGKIVQMFAFLIPLELQEKNELKKFEKNLNASMLNTSSYQIAFESDNPVSQSGSGSEIFLTPPAQIGFRKSENAYIAYEDSVLGYLVLPSYLLTGVYTDAAVKRGTFEMVVVNQDI